MRELEKRYYVMSSSRGAVIDVHDILQGRRKNIIMTTVAVGSSTRPDKAASSPRGCALPCLDVIG